MTNLKNGPCAARTYDGNVKHGLAPTQELFDRYKKADHDWPAYEREFLALIENRRIETTVTPELLDGACLLCSEDKPDHCHRRLVAEYLRNRWGDVEIKHLT